MFTVSVSLPLCVCLEAAYTQMQTEVLWIQAGPGFSSLLSANCGAVWEGREGGYHGPPKLNL